MASYLTTFTGDGSEVHFTATFPVLRLSDLAVVVDNEWLALGIDYLVSGSTATPLATLTVAPGVGAVVTLRSAVGYTPTDPAAVTTAAPTLNETDTELWQAIGDRVAAEAAARAAADALIIASGAEPANVGIAPVIATGSTEVRTVADRFADVLNVKDFGAVGDGVADDTLAIQAAVDYALQYGKQKVYLPSGTYKTSDTIHLGYGIGFANVILEGDGGFGSSSYTRIKASFVDRPIVNIQACRRSGLRNLFVDGPDSQQFTNPWGVSLAAAADAASYIGAGAQTETNTPFCGVCIDGYSGTTPAVPYPRPPYPAFYGGSIPAVGAEYGRSTSSDCFVDRVWFYRTLVGIAVQPNANANGDFMKFTDCVFNYHQIGISFGNVNARSTDYSNCNFNIVHTCIDTLTYKTPGSVGNWAGNVSNVHANQVWRLFNINMDWAVSGVVTNFYSEHMGSIGSATGGKSRIAFIGCSFEFVDTKYSGTTPTEVYPTVAFACSYATFDSCSFNYGRIGFCFTSMPIFRNCYFRPTVYYGDGYYTSATEKLAALWFGGIFSAQDLFRPGLTPAIQKCTIQFTSAPQDYDSADNDMVYTIHGRATGLGVVAPYVSPIALLRGDPGSGALPAAGRALSGRGFTVTTTDTKYQIGDVILCTGTNAPNWFYLESITDVGGGSYQHQWNALCYYTLSGGVYTPPDFTGAILYFPIGIRAPFTNGRFFKTTSGSPDVAYVDASGSAQVPSFTAARKILWWGDNAILGLAPLRPFPAANVKINSIDGGTGVITMSQNAAITAWWADAPGICLLKLGA